MIIILTIKEMSYVVVSLFDDLVGPLSHLYLSNYGDASPAFSISRNPHQHLTCQLFMIFPTKLNLY